MEPYLNNCTHAFGHLDYLPIRIGNALSLFALLAIFVTCASCVTLIVVSRYGGVYGSEVSAHEI